MPSNLSLSPLLVQDFEDSDGPSWWSYYEGDALLDGVSIGTDGLGNHYLRSTGPWWLDGNHVDPGAGYLNLVSILFVDGSDNGIVAPDLRDLTFSFDIRSEGFNLPAGANLYLWFQAIDPNLAWGEGNFVNYVNTSVPIQTHVVDSDWTRVSITLTTDAQDWLALGSNSFREDTYSISANIADALSGHIIDMGLVILLGNGEAITSATGTLMIDNVELDQGPIARVKLDAASVASAQALDLQVTPSGSSTYEGHHIDVGYVGGGGAGETLQIVNATDGSVQVTAGNLFLDGNAVGTVSGGTGGSALSILLTAAIDAADVARIIAAIGYANPAAAADSVRELSISLTDTGGHVSTVEAELSLTAPLDDGSGDDVWQGGSGAETFNGGGGSDTLHGGDGKDLLIGGISNDTIDGEGGDDTLYGGADNDTLSGGGGNDNLFGEAGTNHYEGGVGNDWYHIDSASDVIVEVVGQGVEDRVFSSVSYTLAAAAEIEILSTSFNAGTDPINLTGNELGQAIYGNDGNNILDGKGGTDFLAGLNGDDSFYVDSAGDQTYELAGQGNDRVFASVSYTLAAGMSIEKLTTSWNPGTDAINLTGNELANTIYGNAGTNMLDGKGGADLLAGMLGDDWLYVDNAGDRIVELAGEGNDRVFASVSYTLGAGVSVEKLATGWNPGTDAINLTGNELANTIYGNAGANVLDGRGGVDLLVGLQGDDWFIVDNAADRVVEAAGEGSDRIFASLSYTLDAGLSVEKLSTTNNAGTAAINFTGNELANTIYGNAGANVLDGKGGGDSLAGLGGADIFAFTTTLGGGNIDKIIDFSSADDTIQLYDAVFAGIGGPGTLGADAFVTGAAAADGSDRIIYNATTGALLFDADGSGVGAAVQFATLSPGLSLTASDFVVI